ncbi:MULTISPECIES: hypothetical protein [unclassified Paenibacillus]|uniref:hypothetical protein n=1 Tax=unclassified Paenibacillus TaxID=185978 RepID=UPI00020D6FFC|nr:MULTISPECIES: hypothetical protein [unclassified Paenibacillus]EGL20048.1 hypothetical protein HMPREF9413_1070 [Paenibacillus sp. HGF7]EPD82035.1 hypothetical protein HMPREF1207_03861 [Paenibacillus sp. HGH0039]
MSIRRLGDMRIKPGASGDVQPSDVRAGKTFSSEIDTDLVGTLPDRGAMTLTPSGTGQVSIPDGIHANSKIAQVNVPADKVLTGTTIASVAGTMPNLGAPTFNVSPNNQSILAGYYTGGTVAGDANIRPENIRKGVWIGGVQGNSLEYGASDWIPFGRIQKYRILRRWEKNFGLGYVLAPRPCGVDNRYVSSMSYNDGVSVRQTIVICWDTAGTEVWRQTVAARSGYYPQVGATTVARDRTHVFWTYGDNTGNSYYHTVRKIRLTDGVTVWESPLNRDQTVAAIQETPDGKLWLLGSFYTGTSYSAITRMSATGVVEASQSHSPGNGSQIVVQPDSQYYYMFDENRRLHKYQATGTTTTDGSGNYFGKEQWSLSLFVPFRYGYGAFWAPALGQVVVSGYGYLYANNGETLDTAYRTTNMAYINTNGTITVQDTVGVPEYTTTAEAQSINDGEYLFVGGSGSGPSYIFRTSDKTVLARFNGATANPDGFGVDRNSTGMSWDFGNHLIARTNTAPNSSSNTQISLQYLNTYFG